MSQQSYILVVDDSKAMREITCVLLDILGLAAQSAADGQEALALCRTTRPKAILLDWNMPVMDGPTFQKHFNALPGAEQTKIIFCTVESELTQMAQVMAGGAAEYIMKPFDLDILASKLELAGIIDPVGDKEEIDDSVLAQPAA